MFASSLQKLARIKMKKDLEQSIKAFEWLLKFFTEEEKEQIKKLLSKKA